MISRIRQGDRSSALPDSSLKRFEPYGLGYQAASEGPAKGIVVMSLNPLIAIGVVASTAATDAVYVLFNAAVSERRRVRAASWSSIWYLLSAFAVISYTHNPLYVLFAATGSWIGAFCALTWLKRDDGSAHTSMIERAHGAGKSPPA
jgi:uncharacterized membrane protein YhaH (DUF805 family)